MEDNNLKKKAIFIKRQKEMLADSRYVFDICIAGDFFGYEIEILNRSGVYCVEIELFVANEVFVPKISFEYIVYEKSLDHTTKYVRILREKCKTKQKIAMNHDNICRIYL